MSDQVLRMLFTGDIHLTDSKRNTPLLSAKTQEFFDSGDFVLCNLEGPITEGASLSPAVKAGPTLKQCDGCLETLKQAHINVLGLANNHIADYGIKGIERTTELASKEGFLMCGLPGVTEPGKSYTILSCKGRRIALFGVAENGFGCERVQKDGYYHFLRNGLAEEISGAAASFDAVIVYVHAGAEDVIVPLPELRSIYHSYIEAGADAVIGSHPHICQGVETHLDKPIFYSLGNFLMEDFCDSEVHTTGLVPELLIGDTVTYRCHVVTTDGIRVSLIPEEETGKLFASLNRDSFGPGSEERLGRELVDLYVNRYLPDYYRGNAFHVWENGFLPKLKTALRILLGRNPANETYLFHNLAIETNYWIVRRALEIKQSEEA